MAFRFRQFSIEDQQSTIRFGTDAMLLGSWASPGNANRILDIGTGCGALALMMAQRSGALIEAIDIDEASVLEARQNFAMSPWPSRLMAVHSPLQFFMTCSEAAYGFIISNPPYFSGSLMSPSVRKNHAKHNDKLTPGQLAFHVSRLLTQDGRFALILPPVAAEKFRLLCASGGLYLSRGASVYSKPGGRPKRMLMEFTREIIGHPEYTDLTICDLLGKFTGEYLALTGCFHNI